MLDKFTMLTMLIDHVRAKAWHFISDTLIKHFTNYPIS